MSKTDKTAPWWVRQERGELDNVKAAPKSWLERGSGEKGVKFAKREASKARRRGVVSLKTLKSLRTTYKYNSG